MEAAAENTIKIFQLSSKPCQRFWLIKIFSNKNREDGEFDLGRKVREDPLAMVKEKENERFKKLRANPQKMARMKKLMMAYMGGQESSDSSSASEEDEPKRFELLTWVDFEKFRSGVKNLEMIENEVHHVIVNVRNIAQDPDRVIENDPDLETETENVTKIEKENQIAIVREVAIEKDPNHDPKVEVL